MFKILGLYNYLNSTFEPGSKDDTQFSDGTIAIYSPNESSNDLVRPYHLAVVMTGNATEVVFKYILLCVTFLALALLQFAVVVSIFKLAISKFASMAGNIVGTALGSVTSFVKLASAALVTVGVIFASLLLYNLYAGILVGLFDWADSVIGSFTGSNNIVNYIVKLVIVYFFTHFALRSIMAVSKNLGAMVDEIVQKISMALQQNWARNAALGSMAGAGMGGAYAGAGGANGGRGGAGANGRDGKEPGALAKAGSVLGVGKQAEGLENLWETGGRALDAENKRRQANGEPPLETKGFAGMLNQRRMAKQYEQKAKQQAKENKRKRKSANKKAGEDLAGNFQSKAGKALAYGIGRGMSTVKNKYNSVLDGSEDVAALAKMMRVDEDELAKQRDGLIGNARHAYDNNEKAQESGVTQAGYVDEQVTRNMPGFDKSTVGQDGLRAEMYVDDKGNQAMRFVDENGRTSDEASQVADLYATEQTLDELRNMDTSGMTDSQLETHDKKLQRFENKAERLRTGLANIKTSDGKAKYQSDALAGQGLAKLNNSMQQTFGQRAGTKAGGARGGTVRKAGNSGNLNTSGTGATGGKPITVHGRVEEMQARQANPNMIRSDGLRRGGSADTVKALSENGVSRTVENLYDDQGRSLSDLTAMNNLQSAYDVVNYAKESMENGIDWRQDKVLSRRVENAQQEIDLWQNQLRSSGYDSAQFTQTTLAATMGSLEQSLGRTSEYSDHKQGNHKKTQAFVDRMNELGKKPPKEESKYVSKEEMQVRQANPNMVRSDGLRRGGSADTVVVKNAAGVSRTVENLYDDQGRSFSDLATMSNLQAAYDVVNYANESMENGIDYRQDKVVSRQVENAQKIIVSAQEQLQSSGYDPSQVTQTTIAATMGSLEQSLGRTSEYNDHKRGNEKKTTSFVDRMDALGKQFFKDELKENNNLNPNDKANQKPIAPKLVPRSRNSSPGGRGKKPSGRGSRGRRR